MKHTWVNVALFDNPETAKIFELYLKENKIEARVYNDKLLQLLLFLCPPKAAFRVQVPDPFYRMTLAMLAARSPAILDLAIHSPEYGSVQINYPQMTRKFVLPTLLLHLGIIFRIIRHQAYGEACHCIWIPATFHAGMLEPIRNQTIRLG